MFRNDEIRLSEKRIKVYIPFSFESVSYIYNAFIVHHKATCSCLHFSNKNFDV